MEPCRGGLCGNVAAETFETSEPGVFACGDARMGQSLVVWAINEGRLCAAEVERHLASQGAQPAVRTRS
ncbi:MAG: hypothetical protein R6T85_12780 [Egibacteraceae bacterium]